MANVFMYIVNPRLQHYPQLQSYVTSDFVEILHPKMTQVHGDRVVIITSSDQIVWEADGMVTSLKNIELHTLVADCGNIYAYDPVQSIVGICHSGRQGTHKNIIHNFVKSMKSCWSLTENIVVRTWPCISWKNYQFWPEVKDLFESQYYTLQWESYYLDLPKLHRDQLMSAWILAEHIIQSDICTFDTLELPSYRRQWSDSKRMTWSIMQVE